METISLFKTNQKRQTWSNRSIRTRNKFLVHSVSSKLEVDSSQILTSQKLQLIPSDTISNTIQDSSQLHQKSFSALHESMLCASSKKGIVLAYKNVLTIFRIVYLGNRDLCLSLTMGCFKFHFRIFAFFKQRKIVWITQ